MGPAVFQFGTYLFTAFLVWWERDNLSEFHIDPPAVVLIIIFKPVQTLLLLFWGIDTPLTVPHMAGVLVWLVAIWLTGSLWRSGFKLTPIQGATWAWLGTGLMVGLLFSAILNLGAFQDVVSSTKIPFSGNSGVNASTSMVSTAFFYQIGFAAVSEEPLFRGFLWGRLRILGWSEVWVWLVQALLFLSAHIYFINAMRYNFFVVVPTAGLLFGLLAWRSRSIAPGMVAHAGYNASIYLILMPLFRSF